MNNKIFKFAYRAGLHDATAQRAYPCQKGEEIMLRQNEDAAKIVKEYIDSILSGEPQNFFNVAKRVTDSFHTFEQSHGMSCSFSFGNAQKLINITAKFMYIVVYTSPQLRERFNVCHCPLDRKMGSFVKKKIRDLKKSSPSDLPEKIQEILAGNDWKEWDGTWSDIKKSSYTSYQEIIKYLSAKEELSPIEYDYQHFN